MCNFWIKVNALLFTSIMLISCASMQPLSNYARTGDTVMISLGGEHNRALIPVLKKENIDVFITDSAGMEYPIKLRNLFKLQADLASRMNVSGLVGGSFEFGQGAYQGLWMATIDLIDPDTGAQPPLAVGAAFLNVESNGQIADLSGTHGDLHNIPIEILAGQGSLNPLNEYDTFGGNSVRPVESLEPLHQIDISPNSAAALAGGEFKISYSNVSMQGANYLLRVIPATQDPFVQLITNRETQPDGSTLLSIMVLNPKGFLNSNAHNGLKNEVSDLRSLSVRLVWSDGSVINDSNWNNYIQLVSGRYIDINGDTNVNVTPVLTKIR